MTGPGAPAGRGAVRREEGAARRPAGERGRRKERARTGDPFAALGLAARPEVTGDDVRSAWRRIAAATHPDRADGGDPARFAAAAAAYSVLRTATGRGETLADLAGADRRVRQGRPARPSWMRPDWARPDWARPDWARLDWARLDWARLDWASRERGARAGRVAAAAWRLRHGRPGRLALRVAVAAAVNAGAVAAAGARPAVPAVITGTLTWLALTGRHDLAAPP